MVKRLLNTTLVILMPLVLLSCGGPEPEESEPLKRAQPPEAAVEDTGVEQQAAPARTFGAPLDRNPFLSHIMLQKGTKEETKARGPLECCELGLFRLLAVAVSPDNSYALIQAPDSKRYIVRRGDVLGPRGGKIIRVDTKGIAVREYTRDARGKVLSSNDTEINLPVKGEWLLR
ncbi:MAG TPA: pilus assembly protein PilP [Thermodesulfobacteriota bacterium]|nr:pilus assembly protein PilP [Thermodesulfobacteriota bacterium]